MAVDLEGRYIIQMLEHSVVDYDPTAVKGKFLQMSGTENVYIWNLCVHARLRSQIHVYLGLLATLYTSCTLKLIVIMDDTRDDE